jgi:EmrB/QacA subfamily drug resistance transporter
MGIGGAFIMPSTLSVLTNSFPNAKERAKAIGIWAAVSGLGIVFGPTIGGWLLEHFWWGSVFLVNVPVALAGMVAGYWLVPESRDPAAPRVDIVGAALSVVGLTALVWAIIEAPSRGWTSGAVLAGFGLAVLVLASFAAWEMRVAHPMLNLRYFANPRFAAACLSVTLVFFAMFGMVFFLAQYLQFVLGYSPLAAGQRLIPVATLVLGAPIGIKLSERIGSKVVVVAGLSIVAGALWLLSTTTTSTGYGRVAEVLMLIGFGMGAVMAPATEAIMGALPRAKAGVGSAVNDTIRQIGGALGVAVLGSILSSVYGDRLGGTIDGQPVPGRRRTGSAGLWRLPRTYPDRPVPHWPTRPVPRSSTAWTPHSWWPAASPPPAPCSPWSGYRLTAHLTPRPLPRKRRSQPIGSSNRSPDLPQARTAARPDHGRPPSVTVSTDIQRRG